MGLLDEWQAICDIAMRAGDDLLHLDTTTLLVEGGEPRAAIFTRIDGKGDIDSFVHPAASAELRAIHAEGVKAMVEMHETRIGLVTGIASALL